MKFKNLIIETYTNATGTRRHVEILETVRAGRDAVSAAGRETDQTEARERRPEGRAGVLFENDRQARVRATGHEGRRNTVEPAAGQGRLIDAHQFSGFSLFFFGRGFRHYVYRNLGR